MAGSAGKTLRIAAAIAVAVAAASLAFTSSKGVDTDLVSLLDRREVGGALADAASAMAMRARFLVRAESPVAARERLASYGIDLPPLDSSVRLLDALAPHSHGFLSPGVRRQLEAGEFASVRDAAAARLFSPVPPLISPRADPFLLFTDFALDASEPKGGWVAVDAELSPDKALAAFEAVKDSDGVLCAGAPFHTALAARRSRREINVLSSLSVLFVLAFGFLLVRSFRFLPVLVMALAAAFCVSTAATFAAFQRPHMMTFVFGTTLVGLGVDYIYHSVVAKSPLSRPLTYSFLSSAACFLPLLLSGIGVMAQISVFTVSGLAAAYAVALCFCPAAAESCCAGSAAPGGCGGAHAARSGASAAMVRALLAVAAAFAPCAVALLCSACGISMSGGGGTSGYGDADPRLAEGERLAAEMSESAGLMPSVEEQRRNFTLVRRLYEAEGVNYCSITGLPASVLTLPERFEPFDPKGVVEGMFARWRAETDRMLYVAFAALLLALVLIFRRECLDFVIPVAVSFFATDGLLACIGERSNLFARISFFIFTGLGLDYSIFRWHERRSGDTSGSRATLFSFLTSLAGFGLLGFTNLSATRVMGITVACGLAVSYFAAKMCCGFSHSVFSAVWDVDGNGAGGDSRPWHKQPERCSSIFWARFIWCMYAWFGKDFQKRIFVLGMPVIFFIAAPVFGALRKYYAIVSDFTGRDVRATLPRLFMHVLGFSWSLMDKADACTLRRNLPVMTVRDDGGWRAFRAIADSGKGAFILCSHVGNIGVLPALPDALGLRRAPKVHAFQQMNLDAIFMKVFMEKFDRSCFSLHAVEDIGVETAVEMKEAIGRGEFVVMAGDRVSAGSKSVLHQRFLGRDCVWPKGAFTFARLMESPVFAVTCMSTGWNSYEVHFDELSGGESSMLATYAAALERDTAEYPGQWYQFYDFFAGS